MFNSHQSDRFLPQLNDDITNQQFKQQQQQDQSLPRGKQEYSALKLPNRNSKALKQTQSISSSSSSSNTTTTFTSSSTSSPSSAGSSTSIDESDGQLDKYTKDSANNNSNSNSNKIVLLNLPPIVTNSSIVRQRVSAKNSLAAATVTTGASLPLMIGGRSKCVVNHLSHNDAHQDESVKTCQSSSKPIAEPARLVHSPVPIVGPRSSQVGSPPPALMSQISTCGPKNTALRAEHRICRQQQQQHQQQQNNQHQKHNAISVVRPVVNRSPVNGEFHCTIDQQIGELISSSHDRIGGPLEDSAIWAEQVKRSRQKGSLVDELMSLDRRITSAGSTNSSQILDLDELLMMSTSGMHPSLMTSQHPSEQQMRQQMALYRREQHELNRNVRRQHRFILNKIEGHKRNLQIIQSVWVNKDFKHAIEKLVDIYNQGLIFTQPDGNNDFEFSATPATSKSNQNHEPISASSRTQLSSLNSSLVVDVLSVIILRPKLWTLEICQLVLPIIINDLLMQKASPYEYYIEVAIKSLRLILTHFSGVIKSTLESQKDSRSAAIGVDLSREDRINKCLSCYKLLVEARSLIARRLASSNTITSTTNSKTTSSTTTTINGKLAAICRELEQCTNNCKS